MENSSPDLNQPLYDFVEHIRRGCPDPEAHKLDLACQGANYEPGRDLMVVGRAPNHGKICDDQNLFSGKTVTVVQTALRATEQFGSFEKMFAGSTYNPRRSQFWNLATRVVKDFTHPDFAFGEAIETLAWSNLYKIAPAGRNPSVAMQQHHRDHDWVKKLLLADIKNFKPKALLFMTGIGDGWFDADWLEEGASKGQLKGREGGNSFEYLFGLLKETKTPAIVTPHPQGKPFTAWVTQISQDLKKLSETVATK